ncbi:probable methyltransferase PMT28 isoform X2 [Argentina anserina]|nr:probable methyltransferase PMT28 isoform X2 [Potentilla anserina]
MAVAPARSGRQGKRPYWGFCIKMAAVAILGLCFIFVWTMFSSPSNSATTRIESFDNIEQPPGSSSKRVSSSGVKKVNGSVALGRHEHKSEEREKKKDVANAKNERVKKKKLPEKELSKEKEEKEGDEEEEAEVVDGKEEGLNGEGDQGNENVEGEGDLVEGLDQEAEEKLEDDDGESEIKGKKSVKVKGPVFDPKASYHWKSCSTRSKHNYIPCIDMEAGSGRVQQYRHTERSCPRSQPMCLVPLPPDGYDPPVHWPESKEKILYKNVEHPKLAAFIKEHSWVMESGEYLTFPQNQSEIKGGVLHYLESIEEMVPDLEWGKNIRVVLDIGCTDSAFGASLLDKDVLTLSLGLKDDLVDLAQVSLERGFPTVVSPFGNRRLAFPSGVFDVIHCGGCTVPWHSNGGKHLLELNRILRPGGYFILSTKHDSFEAEEAMNTLMVSICWNILAHKTDEISDVGVRIYKKPESNDLYTMRRKKHWIPLCKENENPDAAWYVPVKICLHSIPSSIEERGSEWPEEWPNRLEKYPDWLKDKDKLIADTKHWKDIVDKSYLIGLGIDWSSIRNVMDMKAIYGG